MHDSSNSGDTTFFFVRHGQTAWNEQGRWQGWLDSPLTQLGIEQAKEVAADLRDKHFDAAYTSDSERARTTAEIICSGHGLTPVATQLLRERNYGGYEGLSSEEIEARFPGSRFQEERDTRDDWRPPQGESMIEVRQRLKTFLRVKSASHQDQTVLAVTHSGVIRALDSLISGSSFDLIWHRTPHNCCIYIVKMMNGKLQTVRDFFSERAAS
jgi:broad specificity phosphatase PhoE